LSFCNKFIISVERQRDSSEEARSALQQFKEEGLIRCVGVSNISLVSIQKWPFSAISRPPRLTESDPPAMQGTSGQVAGRLRQSAGLFVRRTVCTPPRNPLISLILRKIPHF
jgi:hypothetical protein